MNERYKEELRLEVISASRRIHHAIDNYGFDMPANLLGALEEAERSLQKVRTELTVEQK